MAKITKANGPTQDVLAAYPVKGVSGDSGADSSAVDALAASEEEEVETEKVPAEAPPVPTPPKGKTVQGKASVSLPGMTVGQKDG